MIVFIYFMGRKKDVHDKNKITKLLLPLLNNKKGLKVNAKNYFLLLIKSIHEKTGFQDDATSHISNLVQDFLKETIPQRYIKKDQ